MGWRQLYTAHIAAASNKNAISISGISGVPIRTSYRYYSSETLVSSQAPALPSDFLTAGFLDHCDEPACQFADPVLLAEADGLMRDQFAADAQGHGARRDKVTGCLLVDTSGGDQRDFWKWPLQSTDVMRAADAGTWKDLYEIWTSPPCGDHLCRGEGAWKYGQVVLESEFDYLEIESGAG